MGKVTISMAIFDSYVSHYQRAVIKPKCLTQPSQLSTDHRRMGISWTHLQRKQTTVYPSGIRLTCLVLLYREGMSHVFSICEVVNSCCSAFDFESDPSSVWTPSQHRELSWVIVANGSCGMDKLYLMGAYHIGMTPGAHLHFKVTSFSWVFPSFSPDFFGSLIAKSHRSQLSLPYGND